MKYAFPHGNTMDGFDMYVQSYTIFALIVSLGFINAVSSHRQLFYFRIMPLMYVLDIPVE